ncbi:MAG: hypothetical protein WCF36_03230 [Candidatus Nanopelagicales bacterium]
MTPTTHPLVAAYLEELDRLLAGIDPGDRAEVMSGVREHLDTALPGSDPVSDDDVRAALDELGPPQAVADEAYAGRPPATPPPAPRGGPMSRVWVPILVVILQVIALLFVLIIMSGNPTVTTTSVTAGVDGVEVPGSVKLTSSPLFGSLAAIMFTLPLWSTVALLVGLSPLWVGREKAAAVLLVPGAALLMGILPLLGYWLVGVNGVFIGAWTAVALIIFGGGWLMTRLTRRAATRAT